MNLSILAYIEHKYATNLASIYSSINNYKETFTTIPPIIVDQTKLEPDKCYVQVYIPYDMYIDILNADTKKEIAGEINIIKTVVDQAGQFNLGYEAILCAINKAKESPELDITEIMQYVYQELLHGELAITENNQNEIENT